MYDYDNMKKKDEHFHKVGTIIFGIFATVAVIAIGFAIANREPPPPRKPIDWEKVGEGLGDRGARFGHGVVKGAKNASKEMKERDKAEKENKDQ